MKDLIKKVMKGCSHRIVKIFKYSLSSIEYFLYLKFSTKMKLPKSFTLTKISDQPQINVNRVVYCFWTGDNEMSPNRIKCLNYMRNNIGVEIKLITKDNLSKYIHKDAPLHKAYPYLSNVHKADYLRTYFMHHYGGGYADIKRHDNNWISAFNEMESNTGLWVIGYREKNQEAIAPINGGYGIALRKNYNTLIGNCAYICKPFTPLTYNWINNLHAKLDEKYNQLQKHPGGIWGNEKGYPIIWSEILGQIFHPLCYYFNEHIGYSETLRYTKEDYR